MSRYSNELKFEKAKEIRNKLFALRKVRSRQKVVLKKKVDIDIISFAYKMNDYVFVVSEIRDGRFLNQHHYFLRGISNEEEAMETFLTAFYRDRTFIPEEIIVNTIPYRKDILTKWLTQKAKRKVKIAKIVKKRKLSLLKMAKKNAQFRLKEHLDKKSKLEISKDVKELMKILKLKKLPVRIEAFDISNIMGKFAAGSCILFVNGKPRKRGYLHFKIKMVEGINDVAMMKEVIRRRLKMIIELNQKKPHLFIVDGGEGQLNAALSIVKEKKMNIPVIGIAKRYEIIHMPGGYIVALPPDSIALKLVKRIRDESHRFAINYYRKMHKRELSRSILDDINGIGEAKKLRLLKHFGSVKRLKNASFEDIVKLDGFGKKTAKKIIEHFSKNFATNSKDTS